MTNSLGALGIDLFANTATFESDMGRAARIAERDMQKISQIAATAGRAAVTGLMAAGAAVVYFTQQTISARAALDDMADVTGDSVKFLDGLQRAAHIAGVEMTQLQGIITQTAKGLDSKKGATAIGAIGLDLEHLKSLKPAEAMLEIAKALDQYEDGQRKINFATAIWGKEGAKNLALMKDLAEAGIEQGRVTAEQAAAAERAEKEWRKLQLAIKDAGDSIATGVIPSIARLLEQMNEGRKIFGNFWQPFLDLGGKNPFKDAGTNVAELRKELEDLQRLREKESGRSNIGAVGALDRDIADLQKRLEFHKLIERQQALTRTGPEFLDARDLMARQKPALPGLPDDAGTDKFFTDPHVLRVLDMRVAAIRELERIQREAAVSAAELAKATQLLNDTLNEPHVQAAQAAVEAAEKLAYTWNEAGERIQIPIAELDKLKERGSEMDDVARRLGMTFSSAFEDAVVGGKNLSDVLKGLAEDVGRLMMRMMVTEPLAKEGSSFFSQVFKGWASSGFGFGSLGGGSAAAAGGAAAGSAEALALMAGIAALDSGTDYVPRDGLAYLHKGEAIVPASQNRGEAGIVIQHLDMRGAPVETVARLEQLVARLNGSIESRAINAVAQEALSGGNFAGVLRGGG
jgi:hypothetical protein